MAEEADAAHRASETTDEAGAGANESVPRLQPLLVPTTKPDDLSFSHVDSAETSGEEGEEEDGDESGGKNGRLNVCKKSWTAAEDEILADIIAQHGAQRWSSVAQHLPGRMGKQCRERCATHSCTLPRARERRARAVVRADPAHSTHAHAHPLHAHAHAPPPPRAVSVQCPQPATYCPCLCPYHRWFNHLCPQVKKGAWTVDEDRIIMESVREFGTRWSYIVKRMPGRTDNAIKNRLLNPPLTPRPSQPR